MIKKKLLVNGHLVVGDLDDPEVPDGGRQLGGALLEADDHLTDVGQAGLVVRAGAGLVRKVFFLIKN